MQNDFIADIFDPYADSAASKTIERLAWLMLAQPEKYPAFNAATNKVLELHFKIRSLNGELESLLREIGSAHHERGYAIAVEMYKQGLIDGGRMYHAMVTGELPVKGCNDEH